MSSAIPMIKRPFRTIGARLTLWGSLVTFVVCALLCAVLYAGVYYSLRDEIDTFLEGEVYEFLSSANEPEQNDVSLENAIREELGARTFDDLAFRLYDKQEKLLISSEPNDQLAAHWKPMIDQSQQVVFETVSIPGSVKYFRLCSLRTTLSDGRECIAQASYTMERMNASLAMFRRICAIALLLSIAASIIVGRFLATRSLRPMRRIAEDAQAITPERLEERIRLSGTGDELDQIVSIVNDLLTRTQRYVTQLRQFTADASHELRTPLAALRGMTEVTLSSERSVEELRCVLEENISLYERLQRIAEDLLLITRLDAGERILQRDAVDLCQLIGNVVDLYSPVAEERGIVLLADYTTTLTIIADNARMKQVICNLIDNAVKYTSQGRVLISVSVDENAAQITVEDTGIGIPAESLPHVFDRFYRSDQARSSANGIGSGLGLSICQSIVEAHGGNIDIASKPNKGTSVTVTLPVDSIR